MSAFFCAQLSADTIDDFADRFIDLGLRFQNYDSSAYLFLGDKALVTEAKADDVSLPDLLVSLERLHEEMNVYQTDDAVLSKRFKDLRGRVLAMQVRGKILSGEIPRDFETEAKLTFDVTVPHYSEEHFVELAQRLDALIPGDDPLPQRVERFRDEFVIPPSKLKDVLSVAIEECRRRTKSYLNLPQDEHAELVLVTGMHWVGFTVYEGNSFSKILLNQEVPVHIERALELGCHEGYPGHHAHASMLQEEVINKRGWKEYELIQLIGPMAVMNEGAASYAVDLAFTRSERLAFERQYLLPLAGLEKTDLERYYHYIDIIDELNYARTEVARKYLYGGMSFDDAVQWLIDFGLETRGTATQRMRFIDAQRAYVVTYNYGKTLVKRYVEQEAGEDLDARWEVFERVILTPMSPSELESALGI
ncbi:hypothetical protein IMCC3088_217 [Aequoribacter fuscus]|uniref:Uncharacterized protein n=1 Tax=Aequoribacter fuscus TaxID=2518989 RepID=F3KZA6_9GAMM|nr:hypothetical protein [Aequoribacter fuscus]EGG30593.1 hypothetical protein IMCC3088_217 [Aequoribacter fuscus]QHJ87490.1 hypothetical protein EYZ66_03875 [Aequoribacter fuscus]